MYSVLYINMYNKEFYDPEYGYDGGFQFSPP